MDWNRNGRPLGIPFWLVRKTRYVSPETAEHDCKPAVSSLHSAIQHYKELTNGKAKFHRSQLLDDLGQPCLMEGDIPFYFECGHDFLSVGILVSFTTEDMSMNVDELPASPEMDAAVTEALGNCAHVLKWVGIGHGSGRFKCEKCHEFFAGSRYRVGLLVRPYSTDIAEAWELWLQLAEGEPHCWAIYSSENNCVQIEHHPKDWAREFGAGDLMTYGLTPLAICRAFLKAKGVTL